MGLVSSFFLLLLFIVAIRANSGFNKQGLSLCTTFVLYWLLIVFGGCFHLYGLYDISTDVYFLVLIGTISYLGGYLIFRIGPYSKTSYANKSIQHLEFRPIFYVTLIFSLIIIIRQIILMLPILIANGITEARSAIQTDDTLVLSGSNDILIAYFAKPFAKASLILLIINSIRTRFTLKSFISILLILGIYFFSEGGRAVVMDAFFVLFYAIYYHREQIGAKKMKKLIISVAVIAILPVLATLERGGDVFFAIYTYYCGSLQFFSQALAIKGDMFNDHLWGMASFQGFVKPIAGLLQLVGVEKAQVVQDASDFIIDAQTTVYDIAPKAEMNYFYTSFGYAYKDAGGIGVVLIHFLYGIMCKFIDYKEKFRGSSVRWLAIKVTFFFCVLYTMSYFPFGMYLHAMTLVYIIVISSKWFSKNVTVSQ